MISNESNYLLRALEAALVLGPLREGDAVRAAAEGARPALPVLVAAVPLGPRRRGLPVAAAAEPEMGSNVGQRWTRNVQNGPSD